MSYSLKTTAILALTSSLLSSVQGGALPPPTSTSPTCTNNASEGKTFGGFKISCGVDYYGGDLSNSWLPSFEACINDCGNTEGCIDVSFAGDDNGGQCYRKSSVGKLSQNSGVWTALKIGSGPAPVVPGLSCAGGADDGKTYTSANGKHYKVICGKEYYGGDLLYANVPTFEQCLDTCSTTEGCIDVSYVGENCYMKSTVGELIDAEPVWTGEFFVPPPPPVVTTTSSAVSTPTPVPAGPLTCENGASNGIEFTTPAQNVYEIACGVDYAGGDFLAVNADTFEECLTACDENAGCIDLAYVAPRCYLKNTLEAPVALAHVWGAKFLRSAIVTSPTTTSSISSSTTEASSSSTTSEASSTTSEASSTTSEASSTTSEASSTTSEASSTTSEASSTTSEAFSTTSEASSSSTTSEVSSTTSEASSTNSNASSSTTTTSEQVSSTTTTTTVSSTHSPTTTSRAALTTMMVCNRDLCLRAMVNTKVSASASAFCSSYTTAVVTAAAAIPTYLADGCKNLASRVSSACSCVVTPTPAPAVLA